MGFLEVVHSGEVLMRKIFPRKLATSTDLLFPMGKKCDCAENLQCSSFYIFFSILFWRMGGRWIWNETLHFGQFDLIEEYFILLIGLVLNQFRIHFHFPQGKCSSSSFSLLWLCSQEDLNAQEAKSNFCAGWVHGNSVNLGAWLHGPKKSIQQLEDIKWPSLPISILKLVRGATWRSMIKRGTIQRSLSQGSLCCQPPAR